MFGRKIQVDLVKNEKKNSPSEPRETFSERMGVIAYHLESVVKKVAIGVIIYVVADTARQVMIESAKNPQE